MLVYLKVTSICINWAYLNGICAARLFWLDSELGVAEKQEMAGVKWISGQVAMDAEPEGERGPQIFHSITSDHKYSSLNTFALFVWILFILLIQCEI